jgi:hypothetical protein
MEPYSLPHGAKGIEGDEFAIEFRGDKVVLIVRSGGTGEHYTLQAGLKSGVIDLHRTQHDEGSDDPHRTLFAMRRDDLPGILGQFAPMVEELNGLLRPLRVGWMHRHGIGIVRGVDPVSDEDIAAVTRKRKRRLGLDAELYEQNIVAPEYLEDVYDFPDGNFALFYCGRQIGIGFKQTYAKDEVRLFWIKLSDLIKLGNIWQERVASIFAAAAIPPERYTEYPFLRA